LKTFTISFLSELDVSLSWSIVDETLKADHLSVFTSSELQVWFMDQFLKDNSASMILERLLEEDRAWLTKQLCDQADMLTLHRAIVNGTDYEVMLSLEQPLSTKDLNKKLPSFPAERQSWWPRENDRVVISDAFYNKVHGVTFGEASCIDYFLIWKVHGVAFGEVLTVSRLCEPQDDVTIAVVRDAQGRDRYIDSNPSPNPNPNPR